MNKAAAVARPRGRPPKSAAAIGNEAGLSRSAIIGKVLDLTRTEPLQDISITHIARELNVVPGLIYYYIGNRDNLVSSVMNQFYAARMKAMQPLSGNWRADVEDVARTNLQFGDVYPGVVQYIVASRGPYRLFQAAGEDEIDYGMAYFEHVSQAFLQGGFTPQQAALAYRLLAQFVASSFTPHFAAPGVSSAEQVRQRFDALDAGLHPAAKTVGLQFTALDTKEIFEAGLAVLLDGFDCWLQR